MNGGFSLPSEYKKKIVVSQVYYFIHKFELLKVQVNTFVFLVIVSILYYLLFIILAAVSRKLSGDTSPILIITEVNPPVSPQ